MQFDKVAIIGAGNLGLSIAKGMLQSKLIDIKNLILSEKSEQRAEMLKAEGFVVTSQSTEALKAATLVMLVVKPWQIDSVLEEIKPAIDSQKHVFVSCVTGVDSEHIFKGMGKKVTLFRVMPNTGVAVGESMSCISPFNETPEQKEAIYTIFKQLGQVLFMPESQMAAATAMSGCGIAYALRFIRAAVEAGIEVGFSANDAKLLAAQMTLGAAQLILKNDSHPEVEIDKVTTPKGITITALNEMEHAGFSSSIIKGIIAAYDKMTK